MRKSILARVSIGTRTDGRVYISVYFNKKRYRYSNGEPIGTNIQPNFAPSKDRAKEAELLKAAFEVALRNGWTPEEAVMERQEASTPTATQVEDPAVAEVLETQYNLKNSMGFSYHYMRDLRRVVVKWKEFEATKGAINLTFKQLNKALILDFILFVTKSPRAQKNLRLNISALLKAEFERAQLPNPVTAIRLRKSQETLHRPFDNVGEILAALKAYNHNLYICCLLTYGLLLRPHQEVRNLTWGAFSADLTILSLSGAQNKSQRNRIVPVPDYIRKELLAFRAVDQSVNLFSGYSAPFSHDYFKGLWTKFKKTTDLINEGQTIYSFRHSGAIDVFKRTKNLHLLSQLMGHGSLVVTLTYLRGLEITTFEAVDLPQL